jgi:hypothetical protein
MSHDTSEGGFCQFLAIDAWHGNFSGLCWMAEMMVGANLTDEIPAISLKFRNKLTNLHDPQRSQRNHSRSERLYTFVYRVLVKILSLELVHLL